jgi:hypothetical protein
MQVTLGTLSATSPLIALGATPGDVWTADDLTTPGGYAVTLTTTGDFSVALNGDTSRQQFNHDLDGDAGVIYVNNQAPTFDPIVGYLDFTIGVDGTDVNLPLLFADFEGDTLTFALAPGSPSFPGWASLGLTEIIVGVPPSEEIALPVIRASDIAGDYVDGLVPLRSLPASVEVPNLYGEDVDAAAEDLLALFMSLAISAEEYSNDRAANTILSQSPPAFTSAAPGTTVFVVVSKGYRESVMRFRS